MIAKLTPAAARNLQPGAILYDHEVKGLHLRARSAAKSWHLRYFTRAGVERRPKLGRFPEMSLSAAREAAKALKEQVARGEDPSGSWKAAREAPTVDELIDRYVKEYMPTRRYAASTKKQQLLYMNVYVRPGLGRMRVVDVTTQDVDNFLLKVFNREFVAPDKRKGAGETAHWTAHHVKKAVSRLFNRAIDYFEIPGVIKNPALKAAVYEHKRRRTYASSLDLQRIAGALDDLAVDQPRYAAYFWTLFLTGGRVMEIFTARGTQYQKRDDGSRVITLTEHKTARHIGDKAISVPPPAVEILEALDPIGPGDYLFGDVAGWPTESARRAIERVWEHVRKQAGCEKLKMLDARRTFASFGISNGLSLDQVGELLFHTDPQTTKGYAYLMEELRQKSAGLIADAITKAARGPNQ